MDTKVVGRRAGPAVLVAVIILGAGGLAVGRASSNRAPGRAAAQAAEVADDFTSVSFKVKALKNCGVPCKSVELVDLINASFVTISSDDEITVRFRGPVGEFVIGDNRAPQQAIPLPIAVPLERIEVTCQNEAQKCNGEISILGIRPPPEG